MASRLLDGSKGGRRDAAPAGSVVVRRLEDGALLAETRDVTLRVGRASADTFRSVELLLAALGSCTLGTVLTYAETVGLALGEASVELRPTLADGPERVERIGLTLRVEGDLPERRVAALRRVAERCKVHATLAHGPQLELTVEAATPAT